MGFGIAARYKRCSQYWAKHLEYSKVFQSQALKDWDAGGRVAILGSGRLLDVDLPFLASKFDSIALYDADPGAISECRKLCHMYPLELHCQDLTGCMQEWTNQLQQMVAQPRDLNALAEFLAKLRVLYFKIDPHDVVISLNLLSQIPIYWRDRVHKEVLSSWQLDTDENGNYESAVQLALEASMAKLQQAHLSLIFGEECSAKKCIAIFDSEFLYYQSHTSQWQSETAIFCPVVALSNWTEVASNGWLWHIAPQGLENKSHGCIHRVEARSWARVPF